MLDKLIAKGKAKIKSSQLTPRFRYSFSNLICYHSQIALYLNLLYTLTLKSLVLYFIPFFLLDV